MLLMALSSSAPILADDSPDSSENHSSEDQAPSSSSNSSDDSVDDSSDDSIDDSPEGAESSSNNSVDDSPDGSNDDVNDDSPDGAYDDDSATSSDRSRSSNYQRERAYADAVNVINGKITELEKSKESMHSTESRNLIEAQIKALEIQRERTHDYVEFSHDAEDAASGDVFKIVNNANKTRNLSREAKGRKYTEKLVSGDGLQKSAKNAINNFIVYGTRTTGNLGEGERAGVVDSYRAAYGHLPETADEWEDVMKIANGRWPSVSGSAIDAAKDRFKQVYLREPEMSDDNDDAAVTIMAYGLRTADRNTDSERSAIKIFKSIFGKNPQKATDWDTVRAIAYSGSKR